MFSVPEHLPARGRAASSISSWSPASFWWFPTCPQLSLWKLRYLTSCVSLLWWNLKARGTTASAASCVAQPEKCPGWSWLDKVSWSHQRSSQLQDCEPDCGNTAGDIVLEICKQSSLGTAALACQLPCERTYPSFNQPLLPSVPGQSCLANICQHACTHTGINTCIREPYVVKQTLNVIVDCSQPHQKSPWIIPLSCMSLWRSHLPRVCLVFIAMWWSRTGSVELVKKKEGQSWAGKVTALILVSQMETSIKQNAPDLSGER